MLLLVAVFFTPGLALLPHISLAVVEVLLTLNLLAAALTSPLLILNVLVDVYSCYGGVKGSCMRHQQKGCKKSC
jgi:Na+/H+ antiporter NhaA